MQTCIAFDISVTFVTGDLENKLLEWKLPSILFKSKDDNVYISIFSFAIQVRVP